MKPTQHMVLVLFLCTFLTNILDNELCDINCKDTSISDISTGTGFTVIRSEHLLRIKCEVPVYNINSFSVYTISLRHSRVLCLM